MIFGRRCEVDEWQHCIIQAAGELFVKISGKKKRRMRKLGVGGSGEHEKRQLLKEVCMRQEKCVFCSNS